VLDEVSAHDCTACCWVLQAVRDRTTRVHARAGDGHALHCRNGHNQLLPALYAVCDELVLRDLTWRVRTDEVKRYRYFS